MPDSKCVREILPPRPQPGSATPDLHLYGMEDKESKRGKLLPVLRESDNLEAFIFFIYLCLLLVMTHSSGPIYLLVTTFKLTKICDIVK